MATKAPLGGRAIDPLYLALIHELPLRPITSDEDLRAAIAMADALSDRRSRLTDGERDYMRVLWTLVEAYESAHEPAGKTTGPSMLAHLIEARGATQAEVATASGLAESTLSEILKGKRKLNVKHIEALARHFHVAPGVFLEG